MDYLNNFCFLCLTYNNNVIIQDNNDLNIKELEYFIPNYILEKSNITKYICDDCLNNLNLLNKFRRQYLENIIIFNEYVEKSSREPLLYKDSLTVLNDISQIKKSLTDFHNNEQFCKISVKSEIIETNDFQKEELCENIEQIDIKVEEMKEDNFDNDVITEEFTIKEDCTQENLDAMDNFLQEVQSSDKSEQLINDDKHLSEKYREKYEQAYKRFTKYCTENQITNISESMMLTYMTKLSEAMKPSTLWTLYSMLRSTLLFRRNIDISKYCKVRSFLKSISTGYRSQKSKILSTSEIKKFIDDAPDHKYLFTKVILIFGVLGGCRRQELKNLKISHIHDLENELLVKIIDSKTKKTTRTFLVPGIFREICKKYMDTRPPNMEVFFLNFQNGRCVRQVAGINKIGEQPKIIARFLKLPDSNLYTGHCFRRTGAAKLVDTVAIIASDSPRILH